MIRLRYLYFGHYLSCLVLTVALISTSCDRQKAQSPDGIEAGEVRTFTGKWSATGNRQTMQLDPGHQAVIFRVTGTLLLEGKQRLKRGFKADLIGFYDTLNGLQGRSVWTDEHGDKVFSEVIGKKQAPGQLIEGRFLGGTGPYRNINGEYTFKWKRLIYNENGGVSGRAVDLKGWARLGMPDTRPDTTGSEQ